MPAALAVLLPAETGLENPGDATGANAHAEFRRMLVRFAEAAAARTEAPGGSVAALVEVALELRDAARHDGRYLEADLVRERLLGLGIQIRDSPDGTRWSAGTQGSPGG